MGADFDTSQIGSVGTLIGAAMETAGHLMQSRMLDLFEDGFAHSMGSFLYILSAIAGVFIVAIGGNYKYGLWFLFSPALFFWLISARVDSDGAEWQFGVKSFDQSQVYDAQVAVEKGNSVEKEPPSTTPSTGLKEPARVSYFFSMWNKITSATMNGFVGLIHLTAKKNDLMFINTTERYKMLMNIDTADPDLQYLMHIGFSAQCSDYFALIKAVNNQTIPELRREELRKELDIVGKRESVFNLENHEALKRWAVNTGLIDKIKTITVEETKAEFDGRFTCKTLWRTALEAYRLMAPERIEHIVTARRADGSAENAPDGLTSKEVRDELEKKFKWKVRRNDGRIESCGDEEDCEKGLLLMINEVAARMLLHQMNKLDQNLAQFAYDKHRALKVNSKEVDQSGGLGVLKNSSDPDNLLQYSSHSIRSMSATEEYQGKGDFLAGVLSMPYLQGLMLYWLSISFPFFCLAVLVPGRQDAVLLWMSLWFWVKSWDFGFAIVMMVDRMLFALLPHGPPITNQLIDGKEKGGSDPAELMKALLEIDPTYSVNTKEHLIATCLAAVPIVSSALVKKGAGEVVNVVSQGFVNFSGKIGGGMSSYERSLKSQGNDAQAQKNIYGAVQNALYRELQDPNLRSMLGGTVASGAAAEWLKKFGGEGKAIDETLKKAGLLPKGVGTDAGGKGKKLLGGVGSEYKRYQQEIALGYLEKKLQEAAYTESISLKNRELAIDSVRNKYYSHDFSRGYPGGAELSLIKARANFQWAGVASDPIIATGGRFVKDTAARDKAQVDELASLNAAYPILKKLQEEREQAEREQAARGGKAAGK